MPAETEVATGVEIVVGDVVIRVTYAHAQLRIPFGDACLNIDGG